MMIDLTFQILQNLRHVQGRIEEAAYRSGRNPQDVHLVVVSKSQPLQMIQAAYESGVRRFGENYPQEAEKKIVELKTHTDMEWHMIGHLQSRKVPIIASHFQYIHSIDSLGLAEKLNRELGALDKIMPAFLEVNISGEESKGGWSLVDPAQWSRLLPDFLTIVGLANLKIIGLMTMPPYFDDPEMARSYFCNLRKFRDYLAQKIPAVEWKELSMGTSGDFEVAIEEGATFVRIGQAILGPRPAGKF